MSGYPFLSEVANILCLSLYTFCQHGLYFISGETDAAKAMLTHCLDQDPTFSDAHLLMAQVSAHRSPLYVCM